jgi:UDP-N-acetylmuramoylalanine--D-glutamate ligase
VAEDDDGLVITRDGKVFISVGDLTLSGEHNAWNTALALSAASQIFALDDGVTRQALRTFEPLPHRLQPVDDPSGVLYINDSLATNPPALVACMQAFRDRRLIVLIGGHDRGVDDTVLRDEILSHPVAAIVGLPDSGPGWLESIRTWCEQADIRVPELRPAADMDEAVSLARELARPGDVVALSPGAPSFGRYRNYEQRADDFIRAVRESARQLGENP